MRIVSLLARHGTAGYADALADLRCLFTRQMPGVAHEVLVIDNALPPGHRAMLGAGARLIGGSNLAWELPAWDAGVADLGTELERFDFVHLVTTSFRQPHARHLDRFGTAALTSLRGRAVAVGHIDHDDDPTMPSGRATQAWLRTSFVMLPPSELRLLGSLIGVPVRDRLFSGDPDAPFRPNAPISEAGRCYLLDRLLRRGAGRSGGGDSHYGLTTESLRFFETDALAVINERMLGVRLRAQGCALVDVTWLATHAGNPGGPPRAPIPDWRRQLVDRDNDPAPASLLD